MNPDADKFPYNPTAKGVSKRPIEWDECDMENITGTLSQWKALDMLQVRQLIVRWPTKFARMADLQQMYAKIVTGMMKESDLPAEEVDPNASKKHSLIQRARKVAEDAEANEDRSNALKALEIEAKLEALLSQKTAEEDRVVNIFVVTGVPRG